MRPTALFPLACAIVAFVLGMLCLFAGHKPSFLQDYDIISLNTSTLGHDLISTTTSASPTASATSLGSFLSGLARNITDEIKDDIDDIAGEIVDKLADELGIKQWYNLHLMNLCEGDYTPNATAKHAEKNGTHCKKANGIYHFNISSTLESQLSLGKLNLDLLDLSWPSAINDAVEDLQIALNGMFILYIIGIAASGLLIPTSLISLLLSDTRLLSFANWTLSTISFLAYLTGSIIITILQDKAVSLINKYGNDIGLYAYKGAKYLALTWAATALMALAVLAWVGEFCVGRRAREREYREKKHRGGGTRRD